ncbi:hypothetical protein KL86PLE_40329 [uncultured Pleomorphomonas sp.]|uniref:Uncharacterized protein n=1 Tax=uncultured Pleomorphomonas sp. TaxID=442121 RepID=A0A212LG35_9HYPH|nr:hypothetical protein KL86PLE_40329 [uncultured Pleomorphomonas sp.]
MVSHRPGKSSRNSVSRTSASCWTAITPRAWASTRSKSSLLLGRSFPTFKLPVLPIGPNRIMETSTTTCCFPVWKPQAIRALSVPNTGHAPRPRLDWPGSIAIGLSQLNHKQRDLNEAVGLSNRAMCRRRPQRDSDGLSEAVSVVPDAAVHHQPFGPCRRPAASLSVSTAGNGWPGNARSSMNKRQWTSPLSAKGCGSSRSFPPRRSTRLHLPSTTFGQP